MRSASKLMDGLEAVVRVLIHEVNYAPEPTSTGKYTGEMGEWLAARGHEVRVVAAPPYYPDTARVASEA